MAIGTPTVLADFSGTVAATNPTLTGITASVGQTIVVIAHGMTGAVGFSCSAVDNAAVPNIYTQQAIDVHSASNSGICILTAPVLSPLSSGTITVSFQGSIKYQINVSIWSGVSAFGTGLVAHTNNVATTTPASQTVTPHSVGDVIIGGLSFANATAPSAGPGANFTAMGGGSPAAGYYGANAYDITAAGTAAGPAWTITSAAYAAATICLRAGPLNMLTNWSFETNPGGLATGWTDEHTTALIPTYTQTNLAGVTDGTFSQKIVYATDATNNGTQKFEIFQSTSTTPPVTAGLIYTFNCDSTGTATAIAPFIGIEFFNASAVYLGENDVQFTPGATQTVSVSCQAPPGATRCAVYMQAAQLVPTSTMTIEIDNAALTQSGTSFGSMIGVL